MICWGIIAASLLGLNRYGTTHQWHIQDQLFIRYCTGIFFVGTIMVWLVSR